MSRLHIGDIEGAKPNAFGKASAIKGKVYMNTEDIPGARPRYLAEEAKRVANLTQLRENAAQISESAAIQIDRRSRRL